MWKIITNTGEPLTYVGLALLFPTKEAAEQWMIAGDRLEPITPPADQLRSRRKPIR